MHHHFLWGAGFRGGKPPNSETLLLLETLTIYANKPDQAPPCMEEQYSDGDNFNLFAYSYRTCRVVGAP